jgi:large subunit ribosomal protein L15
MAALKIAGIVNRPQDGVRILSDGELTSKVNISVAGASKSAVEKIQKAGGTVDLPVVAAAEAEA